MRLAEWAGASGPSAELTAGCRKAGLACRHSCWEALGVAKGRAGVERGLN